MEGREKTQRSKKATLGIGFSAAEALSSYAKHGQDENFNKTAVAVFRLYLGIDNPDKEPDGIDAATWDKITEEFKVLDSIKNRNRTNGNHGGRPPRKNPDGTQRKPRRNPKETQTEPKGNPDGTQTEPSLAREDRDLDLENSSPPPLSSPSLTIQDEEDAFSDLWEAYPRKTARDAARREFHRALVEDGVAPATILNAVMAQSRSAEWAEDGGRFVPRLDNWLRDGRWADVLSVPDAIPEKNTAAPPAQPDPFEYRGPRDPREVAEEMRVYEAELAKRQQAEGSDA